MLKEALEFQHELGRKSVDAKLLDLPGNKVLLTKAGGVTEVLDKDRTLRKDKVSSLASFIAWSEGKDDLDVWVRDKLVQAYHKPTVPHDVDSLSLELTHSNAWQNLASWNGQTRKQKEAVRILRGPLADTFDEAHLRVFKSLDFSRRSDGSRNVSHVGESLGRSIETKAQTSQGAIPERMVFNLPCFDFAESPTVTIVMAVEVDPEAETIALLAVGDSFRQALRSALQNIRDTLDEKLPDAAVYLG